MLQINTLRVKPSFSLPDPTGATNGVQIIDLTAASWRIDNPLTVINTAIVTNDFQMRPDLMALSYMQDDSKLDYICKFNGVSNPFAMNAGEIMLICDPENIEDAIVSNPNVDQASQSTATPDLRDSFFDPNRLSKKDAARLSFMQKKAASTAHPSATNLPPVFSQPGAQEITVKNGKVVFGANVVATNKTNCPTTLTRAAVKAKLLQNSIFKKSQQNTTIQSGGNS
jgi:hypothetical protein